MSNTMRFPKKMTILRLAALTFMAISISMLDLDDLSWQNNTKSYLGLILFAALISADILTRDEKH